MLREVSLFCLLTEGWCGFRILGLTLYPDATPAKPEQNTLFSKAILCYHVSTAAHGRVMGRLSSCNAANL